MTDRPLAEVLSRSITDFTPAHPERPPWHQRSLGCVEIAVTDNRLTVPLEVADRVRLIGVARPTYLRDDLEPTDWMPIGWGIPSS